MRLSGALCVCSVWSRSLDFSYNKLTSVPDNISSLTGLMYADRLVLGVVALAALPSCPCYALVLPPPCAITGACHLCGAAGWT